MVGHLGQARIACLVAGVGIGDAATAAAVARLPRAISLALQPYDDDAKKTAICARQAGHEILLLVLLEPFDYSGSDPGPQAVLTTLQPNQNLDCLYWTMSRFPGIIGIVNLMGASSPAMRRHSSRSSSKSLRAASAVSTMAARSAHSL